jgi:ribosomal protein S18 acetylase RimI-like enzyme
MTDAEFDAWRPWACEDYAREIAEEQHIPIERTREQMLRFLAGKLPDGVATTDQHLLVAETDAAEGRVGYLWFAPHETDAGTVCWLYDLWVDEPHRGHGYGRAMMRLLEEEARAIGLDRIELNVFASNRWAQRLYESQGFTEMTRQYYLEL